MRQFTILLPILFAYCKVAHPLSENYNSPLRGTSWRLLSVESIEGKKTVDTGIAFYYVFKVDSVNIRINEDIIYGLYSVDEHKKFRQFYIPIALYKNAQNNTTLRKYPTSVINLNRLNDKMTSYNIYGDTLILFSTYPLNNIQYIRYLKRE